VTPVNQPAPAHLEVDAGLSMPVHSDVPAVGRLVEDALLRRGTVTPQTPTDTLYWEARQFGLERVPAFCDATAALQQEMLRDCGARTLEEAWFIERAGLAYDAKLVLLAQSAQERALYALFAGEEAAHLSVVTAFHPQAGRARPGAFLQLLSQVIETADAATLTFVVQVVLEGWGITHYRALARGTAHEGLRAALERIVLDETRHHGAGVATLQARGLTVAARDNVRDIMARFLAMVAVGPVGVAQAVERAQGGLTAGQKVALMTSLDAPSHARQRLVLLKELMRGAQAAPVVEWLEARGCFTPASVEDCARAME
jgi:hypothetical protein